MNDRNRTLYTHLSTGTGTIALHTVQSACILPFATSPSLACPYAVNDANKPCWITHDEPVIRHVFRHHRRLQLRKRSDDHVWQHHCWPDRLLASPKSSLRPNQHRSSTTIRVYRPQGLSLVRGSPLAEKPILERYAMVLKAPFWIVTSPMMNPYACRNTVDRRPLAPGRYARCRCARR